MYAFISMLHCFGYSCLMYIPLYVHALHTPAIPENKNKMSTMKQMLNFWMKAHEKKIITLFHNK